VSSLPPYLRHAARRLLRAPAFAAAAAITLALGIGATTAIFSVVNAVLIRPLSYPRSERLVDLSHSLALSGATQVDQSDATFLYYRRANRVFTDIGAYRLTGVNLAGAGGDGDRSERLPAARVSASMFRTLGTTSLLGRFFRDEEDRPGSAPVMIIGQSLWERKFAADPKVVGRRLNVDGIEHEVIGVARAGFHLPSTSAELWLPIGIDPTQTKSAAFDYRSIARLRDGVTVEAAAAELQRLLPEVPVAFPGRLTVAAISAIKMRAVVRPLRGVVVGNVGQVLWVVLGAVGFVLLVACANVANLFLVRAEGRQQELAVRRALGAGQGAIVGEFLSEAIVLTLIGGLLGVALANAGVRVLRSLDAASAIPRLDEVSVDITVLLVAAGASALAALLVSGLPALRSSSLTLTAALTEASAGSTARRERHRTRRALVVAQVALALVLLTGAGLMARSFVRLRSVDSGVDAAHAYTFRVALPRTAYPSPTDPTRFFLRALDDIAAIPGVSAVGVVTKLPLVDEARQDTAVRVEDRPVPPGTIPNIHQSVFVSPDYFRALGIPLLEGRTFDRPDPARAPREVIVSRALAARYWSRGESAIGKHVGMPNFREWYTVVGVAGDVRGTALEQPPDEIVYLPLVAAPGAGPVTPDETHWTPREMSFVVGTSGSPSSIAARAASVIRAIDPSVPLYRPRAMSEVLSAAAARTTFTLLLLGIASTVALALGAVGIYGVVAYIVSLRAREIALRLALGAEPVHVRRMVSQQSLGVAAVGVLAGLAGAIGVTRLLSALLFGVSPTDPVSLIGASALLLAVALAASWLPARRAAAMDPGRVLRAN
jgi:predicted permease